MIPLAPPTPPLPSILSVSTKCSLWGKYFPSIRDKPRMTTCHEPSCPESTGSPAKLLLLPWGLSWVSKALRGRMHPLGLRGPDFPYTAILQADKRFSSWLSGVTSALPLLVTTPYFCLHCASNSSKVTHCHRGRKWCGTLTPTDPKKDVKLFKSLNSSVPQFLGVITVITILSDYDLL